MLLNEILTKPINRISISTKPTRDKNRTHGFDWLKDGGYDLPKKWSVLGHGAQASAFLHNGSNTAVKVMYVEGTSDPAYQFLRLALNHQNNIHFPKIYAYKQYSTIDDDISKIIINMERLYKINRNSLKIIENELGVEIPSVKSLKINMTDPAFRQQMIRNAKTPALKQALKLMEPLFNNYRVDMHLGNIMMRSNGANQEMVFIDPVTFA